MGAGKDGKQPIQIDWSVRDPAGKKLGTVSQKNEIPQGSLDGSWGKTADAARRGCQGIIKLLPQPKSDQLKRIRQSAQVTPRQLCMTAILRARTVYRSGPSC